MGEIQDQRFQLSFNASLKVDFQGSRVTSDGSLVLVRELDERLGFGELIEQHLTDSRRGKNTQFPFADLLGQSVYSRLAGYEDGNDAERLCHDPAFPTHRLRKGLGSGRRSDLPVADLRDRHAGRGRELRWTGTTQPGIDQQSGNDGLRLPDRPGHGFDGDPSVRRARAERLQRTLRVHLLSPAAAVQPRGRLPGGQSRRAGQAMGTAPRVGKNSCCPRSSGSRRWAER